jgi:hypothetical protein
VVERAELVLIGAQVVLVDEKQPPWPTAKRLSSLCAAIGSPACTAR